MFLTKMLDIKNPNLMPTYLNLAFFCLTFLTLPVFNAEHERIFSDLNNILSEDLSNLLICTDETLSTH